MSYRKPNNRFEFLVVLTLVVFGGISEKAAMSQLTCEQMSFPNCSGTCPAGDQCGDDSDTGKCVCQPTFPPAGSDPAPTIWNLRLQGFGVGMIDVQLYGDVTMEWLDAVTDPCTGERTVPTEIVSLDLSGSHPSLGTINVKIDSALGLPPSLGIIVPHGSGSDFPALSSFDMFLEIEIPGLAALRNSAPLFMEVDLNEIPPRNLGYVNVGSAEFVDVNVPSFTGKIEIAFYWRCPPPFPPAGPACVIPYTANLLPFCGLGLTNCPPSEFCGINAASTRCACRLPGALLSSWRCL